MNLLTPSFSTLTIRQIRTESARASESNQDHITRLAETYGLTEASVRVLIVAGEKYIDRFGRIAE